MSDEPFEPRCVPPRDLVEPVSLDDDGESGPTRHQARRGRWRRTSYGRYVPAATDSTRPEQRILEQSMRLESSGAVTGWGALRMRGVAYCDGVEKGATLPVQLLSRRQLLDTPESVASRAAVADDKIEVIAGVRCVSVERAIVDELMRLGSWRDGVVLVDMVCAARRTSLRRLTTHAAGLRGEPRRRLRLVLEWAEEHSRSPQESRLRLVWTVDAGLPRPLCNRLVYGLDGSVLGCPDLLDVEAGVVGEYNGAEHQKRERYRADVGRTERFLAAGLECFAVVGGDPVVVQVGRMRAARARALARPPRPRAWTIEPPMGAWRPLEPSLDDELDAADRRRPE